MQQISPLIPPTSENPPVFSMTLHHVLFLVLIITTFYIPPSFFKTSSAHYAFKLMESCAIKMYTVIRMIPAGHRITDNILSGPLPSWHPTSYYPEEMGGVLVTGNATWQQCKRVSKLRLWIPLEMDTAVWIAESTVLVQWRKVVGLNKVYFLYNNSLTT